jgi:hypothetical protein
LNSPKEDDSDGQDDYKKATKEPALRTKAVFQELGRCAAFGFVNKGCANKSLISDRKS